MKKQNQNSMLTGRKLSLNKKTISNLTAAEMNLQVGGAKTKGRNCWYTNFFTCGRCMPW